MRQSDIENLKRQAKMLVKSEGCSHSEALDRLANRAGFSNWSLFMRSNQGQKVSQGRYLGALNEAMIAKIISLAKKNREASEAYVEKFGLAAAVHRMFEGDPDEMALRDLINRPVAKMRGFPRTG